MIYRKGGEEKDRERKLIKNNTDFPQPVGTSGKNRGRISFLRGKDSLKDEKGAKG
jgi:hypothetical protein